nr:MAG TPA: outer membrane protein assembly factor [Caudoviricetes sp.]
MKRLIALLAVLVLSLGCAFADGLNLDTTLEIVAAYDRFNEYIQTVDIMLESLIGEPYYNVMNVPKKWTYESDAESYHRTVKGRYYTVDAYMKSDNLNVGSISLIVNFPDEEFTRLEMVLLVLDAEPDFCVMDNQSVDLLTFAESLKSGENATYVAMWEHGNVSNYAVWQPEPNDCFFYTVQPK